MRVVALLGLIAAARAADFEFFEAKIRPVLATRCYVCHGEKTVTSGLRLDSKDGLLKGGMRGPAIVPGDAEISLLIKAISHSDQSLKMPPVGKLAESEIANFAEWIRQGAPDPRTSAPLGVKALPKHWSFQPVKNYPLPNVRQTNWPATAIDSFLLASMEAKGLAPSPAADKRTLLRRLSFDLTGLPPSPLEAADFLADRSPNAYEKVVERLLASPHYGERWGRHWLDLARFAETSGHEFDSEKPDAWRYRDYVIRAFNEDVPYDQFIREQIAGDLMDRPRPDSILGGGFFALHEERNAADDLMEVVSEKTDNQIDVLGKTFLGLTIGCARCHDHKFDPIPTTDYYALAGIMRSTRQQETAIDLPSAGPVIAQIAALTAGRERKINAAWKTNLEHAAKDPGSPMHAYAVLSQKSDKPFRARADELVRQYEDARYDAEKRGDVVFADFRTGNFDGWETTGLAFGNSPAQSVPATQQLSGYRGGGLANSFGPGSNALTGILTSRGFKVTKPYLHVRIAGTPDKTRKREHGSLRFTLQVPGRPAYLNNDKEGVLEWKTTGLAKAMGLDGFLVIADRATDGYIAVEKIVFSDSKEPPRYDLPIHPRILAMLKDPAVDSIEKLAARYEEYDPVIFANIARAEPPAELVAIEMSLPQPGYGLVSREDRPQDVPVFIRGNYNNPGAIVPRGFLTVLSKNDPRPFHSGSGRRALADAMANPDNPLPARVMVNRIWKQHFGAGLVKSVDNFGATGDRPSHPELLDSLASYFVNNGWSIKSMHRLIVMSNAYRMSSQPSSKSMQADPENVLLSHMPVRRLEAESIRDSILAVSGALDAAVYGPSILPHVSPYQDGRGKPQSGPLDANGRRSVYINVRRNYLTPLLLAFDYPIPFTTIGNRGSTAVPSQALMMMNNEFVNQQAEKWAKRIQAEPEPARIPRMFEEAFSRPPTPNEKDDIQTFLKDMSWTDLAHVLFNSKEFIFIR